MNKPNNEVHVSPTEQNRIGMNFAEKKYKCKTCYKKDHQIVISYYGKQGVTPRLKKELGPIISTEVKR